MVVQFEIRKVSVGKDKDERPYTEVVLRTLSNVTAKFSDMKFNGTFVELDIED